jgi:hypothetical protein
MPRFTRMIVGCILLGAAVGLLTGIIIGNIGAAAGLAFCAFIWMIVALVAIVRQKRRQMALFPSRNSD